jgi:hypothetical protein
MFESARITLLGGLIDIACNTNANCGHLENTIMAYMCI